MIDRGDFSDDQRNQVDVAKQRVKLFREHGWRVENGFYIGKLMHQIRKTIIKKSKKPFTLDPTLANLKDQNTQAVRDYNWGFLVVELKKFNIKITADQKRQIVQDQKQNIIIDILQKLQTYDQNLLAFPGTLGNDPSLQNLRTLEKTKDVQSEINFGNAGRDQSIERHKTNQNDIESQGGRQAPKTDFRNNPGDEFLSLGKNLSKNIKSSNALPRSEQKLVYDSNNLDFAEYDGVLKNDGLESKRIIQLHQMQMIDDSGLNLNETYEYDGVIQGTTTQNNTNEIVLPQIKNNQYDNEILDSETTFQYILNSLMMSFELQSSQAQGLLANNNKYLIISCIKGTKGADYSKIYNWFTLILNNIGHLIFLMQQDLESVPQTLTAIKSGLYSKDPEVANMCCRVFTRLMNILNENSQSGGIIELRHSVVDWLIRQKSYQTSSKVSVATTSNKGRSPSQAQRKNNSELDGFLSEAGLKAFIRAQMKHGSEFIDQFSLFLIQTGQDNYIDLFTVHLRNSCSTNKEFLDIIHDLNEVLGSTQSGKIAWIESGVLNLIIDICLQLADHQSMYIPVGQDEKQNLQLSERSSAMLFLVELWRTKPELIQSRQNEAKLTEAITGVLKKGCRDQSKNLNIFSMNLMACLLTNFAQSRNKYAPFIYKAMTFIMIENYWSIDLREEMLNNFITLFKQQQTIPIQILCEPLFKQIKINLERQEFSNQNILQENSGLFSLNSTDFEFFMNVAIHPKLSETVAIQLLEIVTEISRQNIIFTRISLKLILTVLNRFENNTKIFEFCQNDIKKVLNIIATQDHQKVQLYQQIMTNPRFKTKSTKISTGKYRRNINNDLTDTQESNVSITSSQAEIIDDSNVQSIVTPKDYQEESSRYMQMRTKEKMIVNQLTCYIGTGIKVMVDFIRQQLLDTYIKIERKNKFRNKGILHLLQSYEQDVAKMLQYYYREQNKIKAEKQRQIKIQRDQDLAARYQNESEASFYNESILNAVSFAKNNDETFNNRDLLDDDIFNSIRIPQTVKKKGNQKVLSQVKLQNKLESIQKPFKSLRQNSIDPYNIYQQSIQEANTDYSYDQDDYPKKVRISSIEPQKTKLTKDPQNIRALSIGRSKMGEQMKLYNLQEYENEEQKYIYWVKQYIKLYKAMFNRYSNIARNKSSIQKLGTFDEMQDNAKILNLQEVNSFLNDFKILQRFNFVKRDDIKKIIKLINLQKSTTSKTMSELDLEGFIEFQLQLAHLLYQRDTQASVFMPLYFKYLKEVSLNSAQPLFQRLFEDPSASGIGDPEMIKELTRLVNQDPYYELPPGYIKFKTNIMVQKYNPAKNGTQAEKIATGILDDLFLNIFGDHYVRPEVEYAKQWGVKPDIFQSKKKQQLKPQYLNVVDRLSLGSKKRSLLTDFIADEGNKTPNRKLQSKSYNVLKSVQKQQTKPLMKSSIEPEIDISLKIHLAQNLLHPNREYLKEAAYLMDDMLKAVEKGERELSPATREKHYSAHKKTKSLSKYQAEKLYKAQVDLIQQQDQEQLKLERQQRQKFKVEVYKQKKQIKQYEQLIIEKEKALEKKKEEKKKEERKKKFYEELKTEFVATRLPEIQSQHQKELLYKKQLTQKKKNDKLIAEEQIQKNAKDLSKKFAEEARKRSEERKRQEQDQMQFKRKQSIINSKLAESHNKKDLLRQKTSVLRHQSLPKFDYSSDRSPSKSIHLSNLSASKIQDSSNFNTGVKSQPYINRAIAPPQGGQQSTSPVQGRQTQKRLPSNQRSINAAQSQKGIVQQRALPGSQQRQLPGSQQKLTQQSQGPQGQRPQQQPQGRPSQPQGTRPLQQQAQLQGRSQGQRPQQQQQQQPQGQKPQQPQGQRPNQPPSQRSQLQQRPNQPPSQRAQLQQQQQRPNQPPSQRSQLQQRNQQLQQQKSIPQSQQRRVPSNQRQSIQQQQQKPAQQSPSKYVK